MSNEIFDSLGVPNNVDPLSIAEAPTDLLQSALRDRMETVALLRSTNYETFPLYGESFLLAIVRDLFEQDSLFRYDPDPVKSKIMLSVNWNARSHQQRDRRPMVVIAFQGAQSEEAVMGNTFQASGINLPLRDTKGVVENSMFRITVIHHNRNLALFLGQQVRGAIAANMELMRQTFRLQKVYPPSIQGPGQLDQYDDLFASFIDLRVQSIPRWEVREKPKYIRKIIIQTTEIAGNIIQEAIVEPPQQA